MSFVKEFLRFLKQNKKLWLAPFLLILLLIGGLLVLANSSPLAPFIYVLFQMTVILGISAFYHDSAACLVVDGEIKSAVQEERFTRKRHDASFPTNSVKYCLAASNLSPQQIDYVVFYDKPFLKFDRILETYLAFAPRGFKSFSTSLPVWLKEKLFQKQVLAKALEPIFGYIGKILLFSEHHLSHAASAFSRHRFKTPQFSQLMASANGLQHPRASDVATKSRP